MAENPGVTTNNPIPQFTTNAAGVTIIASGKYISVPGRYRQLTYQQVNKLPEMQLLLALALVYLLA
jgi:hypothetical protein